jgi:hypothetical protein
MIGMIYTDEHIRQIAREEERDQERYQEQREWERQVEAEEERKAIERHQQWLSEADALRSGKGGDHTLGVLGA